MAICTYTVLQSVESYFKLWSQCQLIGWMMSSPKTTQGWGISIPSPQNNPFSRLLSHTGITLVLFFNAWHHRTYSAYKIKEGIGFECDLFCFGCKLLNWSNFTSCNGFSICWLLHNLCYRIWCLRGMPPFAKIWWRLITPDSHAVWFTRSTRQETGTVLF